MKLFSFRETPSFTKNLSRYLNEDEYFALQNHLLEYPDEGDVIRGSNGIRKTRWSATGRGKRGGTRIIYYWADAKGYIFMLDIYPKNKKEDLSQNEISELKDIVKGWLNE